MPIHKKKSRSTLSNYRPISFLKILSKVMVTIVNCSVTNFLERNSMLSPCQFDKIYLLVNSIKKIRVQSNCQFKSLGSHCYVRMHCKTNRRVSAANKDRGPGKCNRLNKLSTGYRQPKQQDLIQNRTQEHCAKGV